MHLGEPDTKRQRRIVLGIAAFFVLLIFFAFNKELINVLQLGWARLKTLIQVPLNVPEEYIHSEVIMLYNGWGGLLRFLDMDRPGLSANYSPCSGI